MTVIEALHWCEDFQTNIITKVDRLLEKHRFALDATSIAKSAILCRIPVEPSMHKVDCDFIQIGNARWCKGTTVYKCPCCDSFVSRIHKFCFNCGQALDWGTEDESREWLYDLQTPKRFSSPLRLAENSKPCHFEMPTIRRRKPMETNQ